MTTLAAAVPRSPGRLIALIGGALVLAAGLAFVDPHGTGVFTALNDARGWVDDHRDTSPLFTYGANYVRYVVALVVGAVQAAVAALGWLGVTGVLSTAGLAFAGWRTALGVAVAFAALGVLGLWPESADTLALTVAAVLLVLLIGVPLGVLAGSVRWVRAALNPLLDVMQIMPTFAYLAPMTLLFLIGAPSATIATLVYAIPPAIRITALGIREVPVETVEAARSLGSTRWQTLRKVRLPMARSALRLAANQTLMMALSMVVVTALIDAPGLGETIVRALERVNVGAAFDAGLAIVILAIALDRLTTNATRRPGIGLIAVSLVISAVAAFLPWGKDFPEGVHYAFARPVNQLVHWMELNLYQFTDPLKNAVTTAVLNPLQDGLTAAPWWLIVALVVLAGAAVSGVRAAAVAGAALLGVAALGLWEHAMETLGTVLVATALSVLAGIVLGVLAARHARFAAVLRPLLDAAQTMPSFVYLLPAVALFGASRFTAIAAAVIYATPPVVRLVQDGVRAVPADVVEAAVSAGSTSRQLLWKVQLPVAREGLLLAANQGIVMVLAMVVVGGLVGAGALGYDVVAGFSQREDFGKGFAAGIAIVLLGVVLDRLTQGAGRRRHTWRESAS
ncbi:ABC transporter permease [Dactylosporangium sp. CA-092794]|uniref:ABC transporter permease n=1 Tax=Dactylosporangium sp. CA-092794 TaxID=3239929 RepID=UPI003D8BBABA